MKNQPDTGRSNKRARAREKVGTPIASHASVLKEQEMAVDMISVHPIDTLLVQRLEHILDGEKALRARYSQIDPSANTPEVRMAFSKELSELKENADRLYRLVNAMDYYGSYEAGWPAMNVSAMA